MTALVADTKPAGESIGTSDHDGCLVDFFSGRDEQDGEAVIASSIRVMDLDLSKTDRYRTHWPFLRDRRIDSYAPITKRFIELVKSAIL